MDLWFVFAGRPITNLRHLGFLRDSAVVVVGLSHDNNLRSTYE